MKEKILFDYKRIFVSFIFLMVIWVFAHIPASAADVPFDDLAHQLDSYPLNLKDMISSYSDNYMEIVFVDPDPGFAEGYYQHTSVILFGSPRFCFYQSQDELRIRCTSDRTSSDKICLYVSWWGPDGTEHGGNYRWLNVSGTYESISDVTGYQFKVDNIISCSRDALVLKDYNTARSYCSTGVYKNEDVLYKYPDRATYKDNLGYVKISDFKKVNLEHGVTIDLDPHRYTTVTDCEYQFSFERYSTTGLDLLHQYALENHHSNSKYDDIELNVVVQPVIFYIDKNNQPTESPYSGRAYSIWFGDEGSNSGLHLNFNDIPREGFQIRQSQLDALIPEAYADIERLRSDLVNPHDALYVVWRFLFKLEGHFWNEHHAVLPEYDYGPTLIVTLPSSFELNKNPNQEPVITTQGYHIDLNTGSAVKDDFYNKTEFVGSISSGITWDEAYLDALNKTPSSGTGGLDLTDDNNILDNTKSLLRQLGGMPEIIGTLFSFMPPWVLTLFSVGFSLLLVLIIYKLARG